MTNDLMPHDKKNYLSILGFKADECYFCKSTSNCTKGINVPLNQLLHNKEITHLDLSSSIPSSVFPEEIYDLPNLTCLNISNNQHSNLPIGISRLKKLKILELGGNKLSALPEDFYSLENLECLNLSKNNFINLPDLSNFKKLIRLELSQISHNFLSKNDYNFFFSKIPSSIETLYVNGNNLTEFPTSILDLTKLRHLNLGKTQSSKIPERINRLKNLVELDLCENGIQKLPQGLWDLTNLKYLYLNGNPDIEIEGISRLRNLRSLNIKGTQINLMRFSSEIAKMTNLTELSIDYREMIQLSKIKIEKNLQPEKDPSLKTSEGPRVDIGTHPKKELFMRVAKETFKEYHYKLDADWTKVFGEIVNVAGGKGITELIKETIAIGIFCYTPLDINKMQNYVDSFNEAQLISKNKRIILKDAFVFYTLADNRYNVPNEIRFDTYSLHTVKIIEG